MKAAILSDGLMLSSEFRIAAKFEEARSSANSMAATDLEVKRTSAKSFVPMVTAARLIAEPPATRTASSVSWPKDIRLPVVAPDCDQLWANLRSRPSAPIGGPPKEKPRVSAKISTQFLADARSGA